MCWDKRCGHLSGLYGSGTHIKGFISFITTAKMVFISQLGD